MSQEYIRTGKPHQVSNDRIDFRKLSSMYGIIGATSNTPKNTFEAFENLLRITMIHIDHPPNLYNDFQFKKHESILIDEIVAMDLKDEYKYNCIKDVLEILGFTLVDEEDKLSIRVKIVKHWEDYREAVLKLMKFTQLLDLDEKEEDGDDNNETDDWKSESRLRLQQVVNKQAKNDSNDALLSEKKKLNFKHSVDLQKCILNNNLSEFKEKLNGIMIMIKNNDENIDLNLILNEWIDDKTLETLLMCVIKQNNPFTIPFIEAMLNTKVLIFFLCCILFILY